MALSNELISQFVKTTQDKQQTKNESTAYGKIIKQGDVEYVQLDGSDLLTPISSTTVVKDGDRVMVTIKNHTAIVTGDLTNPSASDKDVKEIGNKISEFEIIIADKVTTEQLEAEVARIDKLVADEIDAVNGKFETIEAEVAKIDTIETDIIEVNKKITAHEGEFTTIRGEIADFENVTTKNIEAIDGDFHTLESDYAAFKEVTAKDVSANKASINELETNKLDTETANAKYATIDFSNIGNAAIEKLFTDSGIIKDLIMSDGKVTGELVGVTIKGDLIEGNTVKADKLVILGTDGLYYKLNVNSLGETTAASDEKYQNGLDGSNIIAESITAEKIAVDDLVAFGATIGGFKITDHALYSGVKESISNTTRGVYLGDDGQVAIGDSNNFLKYFIDQNGQYKLEIQASNIKFGVNSTTIEEYVNELENEKLVTIKEVEGSELVIKDGKRVIDFIIDGKSEQETRSGKNLIDFGNTVSTYNATSTFVDDILTVTQTESITYSNVSYNILSIIQNNPGKTLKFCCESYDVSNFTSSVSTLAQVSITHADGTKSYQDLFNSAGTTTWYTIPDDVSTITQARVRMLTNNSSTAVESSSFTMVKPMLIFSTENEEYEKYGVSPSPDYPSEIESVGYENLYQTPDSLVVDGITYTKKENGMFDIKGTGQSTIYEYVNNLLYVDIADTKLINGETYTFSVNQPLPEGLEIMCEAYNGTTWLKHLLGWYLNSNRQQITSKIDLTNVTRIRFVLRVLNGYTVDIQNLGIMLVKGKVSRSYIPCNKYGVEVIHRGENLYNYRDTIAVTSGVTADEDGWITATCDNTNGTGTKYLNYFTNNLNLKPSTDYNIIVEIKNVVGTGYLTFMSNYTDSSGNKCGQFVQTTGINFDKISNGTVHQVVRVTRPSLTEVIQGLRSFIQWEAGKSGSITFRISVLEDTTITADAFIYESFMKNITTLLLNEPLRSLSDGTKDVAYIQNGKLYVNRRIGRAVLDGNETITCYGTYMPDVYRFAINKNLSNIITIQDSQTKPNILSNKFVGVTRENSYGQIEGICYGTPNGDYGNFIIYADETKSMSASEFKTWLSENNVEVLYELAEPITEELDKVEIFMDQERTNVYETTDPLIPNLYCKYYTIYAGLDGSTIESIKEEYYLSTSKENPTGGIWTEIPPTWRTGMYVWSRSKIVYSNPDAIEYTTPICDSSWEAVNVLEQSTNEQMNTLESRTYGIENSVTEIKSAQQSTDVAIESINNDINKLSSSVETKMSSEDVQIAIQSELSNGVTRITTTTGFTFNDDGLTISKSDSEMSNIIDEHGMVIKRGTDDRLVANNEGVVAYDLHAKTYLIVGSNSRFEDYEKDREPQTGCFNIGQKIPTEYQELEYLDVNGTQYIDTGYTPTGCFRVDGKINALPNDYESTFVVTDGYEWQVGFTGGNARMWNCFNGVNSLAYIYEAAIDNKDFEFSVMVGDGLNIRNIAANIGNIYVESDCPASTYKKNLFIFGYRNDYTFKGKCYYMRFYDDEVLVRDFVPCYRKSDNVKGMYDTVNNVFYTSSGTGAF